MDIALNVGILTTRKILINWNEVRRGPPRYLQAAGFFLVRRGWQNWPCPTWRRDSSWNPPFGPGGKFLKSQVFTVVCTVVHSGRLGGNGHRMRGFKEIFRLDNTNKKKWLIMKTAEQWNRVPRKFVLSVSLEVFSIRLDRDQLVQLWEGVWIRGFLNSLPDLYCPVILG